MSVAKTYHTPMLDSIIQRLSESDIELQITKKRVKNINFRLKPYQLAVSAPTSINKYKLAQAIAKRLPWVLSSHPQVLARYQRHQSDFSESEKADQDVYLWGEKQTLILSEEKKIAHYRQHLAEVMPELFAKWQPIVGAEANETRIKKMHTRWGSCNTRARRIWLSVYLPAYPIECTEYVIVHELCHLHHANHSRAFWQTVAKSMPDYRHWHDRLAGKTGKLD